MAAVNSTHFSNPATRQCNNCMKNTENAKVCAACKNAFYCSKDCQRANWPRHKPVCQLKQAGSVGAAAASAAIVPAGRTPALTQTERYLKDLDRNWHPVVSKKGFRQIAENHRDDPPRVVQTILGMGFPRGSKMIHLGAGSGADDRFLLESGHHVISVDNLDGFTQFREPLRRRFPQQLTVVEQDLTEFPFPKDGTIKYVLALATFPYCPPASIIRLLSDIRDSLQVGGILETSFHSAQNISPAERKIMQKTGTWAFPDLETTKKLLEELGFDVLKAAAAQSDPRTHFVCQKKG
jgi:hypothetical protein